MPRAIAIRNEVDRIRDELQAVGVTLIDQPDKPAGIDLEEATSVILLTAI